MVLADKESPQTVLAIGNTLDLAQQMLFKIRDFCYNFHYGCGVMSLQIQI